MTSITIVGAGIVGLSCAWELIRRGASVQVLEAERIGAGSSGGHVGALAPHAPENWNPKKAFQLASLLDAPHFWHEVETIAGRSSGYARSGRLQPVPDRAMLPRLQARIDAAAERWPVNCAMRLTDTPKAALIPDSPTGLWIEDRLTARLNPRAALIALAAAIRARGGTIHEGQPATPERLAGPVLWATGTPGLQMLSRDLDRDLGKGVKGQSALLAHDAGDAPQIFANGLHIVPHGDGTTAVGSTSENAYSHARPDHHLQDIIDHARQVCPALGEAKVIDRWAGLRPRAKSRAPLLGPWPGRPGHYVANGGFKIGFGMAPGMARLMADLLLEGRDRIPPQFRLSP